MKKSELKKLLKVIAEEVVSAKKARLTENNGGDLDDAVQAVLNARDFVGNEAQALKDWESENRKLSDQEKFDVAKRVATEWSKSKASAMNETKGLSGFKKSKESTDHTENVADSKSLTPTAEPKEKEEGKKLPVVKKPATPSVSLKEEIMSMIRESIAEMARTAGSIGSKYKAQDPSSPTGWVVKGHKTIPDGTPTEAPKGPYVPKGDNPNMGRPKKAADVDVGGEDSDEVDDDEAAPEPTGGDLNSKIDVVIDGDNIGELDLAKIKGSVSNYLSSMLRANNFVLKLDPAVNAKLDEFSDLWVSDKLPAGSTLNLALGSNSIKLV